LLVQPKEENGWRSTSLTIKNVGTSQTIGFKISSSTQVGKIPGKYR